jgi:hypothetical protein
MTAEEYYQSRNGGKDSQTSEKHSENYTPAAWVQMMQDYGNIAANGWKEAHEVLAEHYRHSAEMRVKEQNDAARLRVKLGDSYNVLGECIDAINWALENCKPDRPELQSDLFNILTNAMEAGNRTLRGEQVTDAVR